MSKTVNLAFIGCGSFAEMMHLPLIKENPKYKIVAVMDIFEEAAKNFAEKAGAERWYTNVDELLACDDIDAVLITTRHDSHKELTVKAAKAGKHVLCEKPMALSVDECEAIVAAVKESGIVYTVGYNRGMAPMILKTRELLAHLSDSKKMIYHRIQAPFPEDSWTHIPEIGGGRFVGEGCHIFDLICELVDRNPVSVYAAGGTFLDQNKVKIPDSAIVTISFEDGSVGTTIIASAGCPSFPKEATEVYCANKAVYISDFKHMENFGFDESVQMDYPGPDKGHKLELDMFADAILSGGPVPNGLVKAMRAAVISYKVLESLKTGLPVSISVDEYVK